jgi:hypothetical protein
LATRKQFFLVSRTPARLVLINRPVPVDTRFVGRLDDDDSFRDYNQGPPVWALVCVVLGIAGAIALVVVILVD